MVSDKGKLYKNVDSGVDKYSFVRMKKIIILKINDQNNVLCKHNVYAENLVDKSNKYINTLIYRLYILIWLIY